MTKKKSPRKRKRPDTWKLPPARGERMADSETRQMEDGEPSNIQLRRYPNDGTMRGERWTHCCGCDFQHLETYAVFVDGAGRWYLQRRLWAVHKTRPKYVIQHDGLKVRNGSG